MAGDGTNLGFSHQILLHCMYLLGFQGARKANSLKSSFIFTSAIFLKNGKNVWVSSCTQK